jgi:crotonobetainyl-CoA:carnitine CoA-transferase CaiB-like acyl-CoA transferase
MLACHPDTTMTAPPLTGIRIVDFTRVLAGPLSTMVLADLGAEVIKIERPHVGDDTRSWGPPELSGEATYFLAVNRGKRSVSVDLTTAKGQAAVRELIADADVIVENFRTGVLARFGLDYESLKTTQPNLVYCSIPAYADPGNARPGYDLIMQAATGHMSLTGTPGHPTKAGVALMDIVTGLYATVGILAALRDRDQTGLGQQVTVGLYDASLSALANQAAAHLLAGAVPAAAGNAHPSIVPYQLFEAEDRPLVLAAGNDKLFSATAEILGRADLATDPRFATNSLRVAARNELIPELSAAFAARPAAYWLSKFERAGIPASAVLDLAEVFDSPEGQSTLMHIEDPVRGTLRYVRTPIRLSRTPLVEPSTPPPFLGQHSS